ncbi:hypothetical protein TNIN_193611 [Trichonephila inaurata madagascariensis]|uniref:Uncharacterized protein n=1 Tax=Trichonephila inaurata madagascariensis TaxID=2747483 RepID=A0A8X7CJY8_9ARAC|nr:hypothetical protein TNIN_193611 [Trichonephila inaurata madagascariensis]
MDAIIMEGTRMRAGAVGAVTEVASPVSLSRKIMEQSDHVLLIGAGAHQFAQNSTAKRREELEIPNGRAGGFADDFIGVVSTTGHGEAIMRVCLFRHITGLMQQGMSAHDAVVAGLEYMKNRVQGYGGAICVSNSGDIGVHFTTEHMAWGYRKGNVIHFGFRPNEDISDVVQIDCSP